MPKSLEMGLAGKVRLPSGQATNNVANSGKGKALAGGMGSLDGVLVTCARRS